MEKALNYSPTPLSQTPVWESKSITDRSRSALLNVCASFFCTIPPLKGEYRCGNEIKQDYTMSYSARRVQMGMLAY